MTKHVVSRQSTRTFRRLLTPCIHHQTRHPQAVPPLHWRRGFATHPKDDGDKDFKGQLWQSTTNRVQRERQEQERFARHRNLREAGRGLGPGGAVAFTTCKIADIMR